ncbi:MAG: DUF4252 domain-containing protein [Prolixibacteraceae bacterium]
MNFIYRIGILIAMLLSFLSGFSQSRAQKIFDRYPKEEGFTYFTFTKSMIDMMNLNLDEEGKKITGDFSELRLLIYNSEKAKIKNFSEVVSRELASLKYEQIHPKGEKPDDNAEFWVEGKGDKISECHMIIGDKEKDHSCILLSFYGNFKVEDLNKLEQIGHKTGH